MMKIAVLDDWQKAAPGCADWTALEKRAEVTFFDKPFAGDDDVVAKLKDFDVLMALRERTGFSAALIARLPKLKMFSMTGMRATTIDFKAIAERGITITYTTTENDTGASTAELALGLMLSAVRRIPQADASMRRGAFNDGIPAGFELHGKTLGVVGLGKLGGLMASYGRVLKMNVIAWSSNLTQEKAAAAGAILVNKDELFARSDVISLHMVLSDRSRGIVGAADLARMKKGALLINTSRGPLIDETALIAALKSGNISAALDVYDREPLPHNHPFRTMSNTVLTPHIGYGTVEALTNFYQKSIANVLAWLDGKPINIMDVSAAPAKTPTAAKG
jgi:phosphoglycerate dehydrogenase-like enzyme